MVVAVFHKIGEPTPDHFTHSIEQILAFEGVLTFDGAYLSVFEHREALAPRKPLLFVLASTVGSDDVMGWSQIAELKKLGFIIGWHGVSHRRLTEMGDAAVYKELENGRGYKLYAYPHGDWDQRVADIVKSMGYEKAYSTTQGEEGNAYAIPRVYI